MMKMCFILYFIASFFNNNLCEIANWQLDIPAKEHVSSYQIVCEDWKLHYSVNDLEYQYYLELSQDTQWGGEQKKFVVLSNDRSLMYQTVYDSLMSGQDKNYEKNFYWLGYE